MSHSIPVRVLRLPTAQGRSRLKILLLKIDHIGDFLTAIEAFRALRRAFPSAEMTLICLPSVVALAESTGLFDRVAGFAGEPDSAQMGRAPRVDVDDLAVQFKALLDGPYFLAADFKHDTFGVAWLDYVEAECRAGFARQTGRGLDILIPSMEWDVRPGQMAGRNYPVHAQTRLVLLARAIVDSLFETSLDEDLFHPPASLDEDAAFNALRADGRLKVGVSVGAGAVLRQWRRDYWGVLLNKIAAERPAVFVFFGGPGDRDETASLIEILPGGSCVDLTGAVPLPQIPAYMGMLDAYIGGDTGLTHLAGRLGLPVVNIFAGISNLSVWRARGPKVATVYAEVGCAPCHLRFEKDCPNRRVCMDVIVPDIVHACLGKVLEG